jgi:ribosomal protein L17
VKINKQKLTLEQRQNALRNQNNQINQLNSIVEQDNKIKEDLKKELASKTEEISMLKSLVEEERKKALKAISEKETTEGALRYVNQKYNEREGPTASLMADHKSDINQEYKFSSLNTNFMSTATNKLLSTDFKEYKQAEFLKPVTQFSKLNQGLLDETSIGQSKL